MTDIFEVCSSTRFLAGGVQTGEKQFEYPSQRPWVRQVTSVHEYLHAIRRGPSDARETSWHVLERRYLDRLRGLDGTIRSFGCGQVINALDRKRTALSNQLAVDRRISDLAAAIGVVAQVDSQRLLSESLGETPYGHLAVALAIQELLPQVTVPVVEVLVDAYVEGLMPYGIFNMRLDPTYCGPDILLCIDPANLELD